MPLTDEEYARLPVLHVPEGEPHRARPVVKIYAHSSIPKGSFEGLARKLRGFRRYVEQMGEACLTSTQVMRRQVLQASALHTAAVERLSKKCRGCPFDGTGNSACNSCSDHPDHVSLGHWDGEKYVRLDATPKAPPPSHTPTRVRLNPVEEWRRQMSGPHAIGSAHCGLDLSIDSERKS